MVRTLFRNFQILVMMQLSLLISGNIAHSQDGLYAAPPPSDAVFVRFIGFSDTSLDWRGLQFNADETSTLEDYFVVHADTAGFEEGSMITVIPDQLGEFVEIVEPVGSAGKISLGFVNLGGIAASLKTSDGKVAIVESVESFEVGFRQVNPISISVAVFAGSEEIGGVLDLILRRGQSATVVLSAHGELDLVESEFVPGVVE